MKREEQERKTISRAHLGRDSVERERDSQGEREQRRYKEREREIMKECDKAPSA